jgi:hypothetical protein
VEYISFHFHSSGWRQGYALQMLKQVERRGIVRYHFSPGSARRGKHCKMPMQTGARNRILFHVNFQTQTGFFERMFP